MEWTLETQDYDGNALVMGRPQPDRWIRYDHSLTFANNLFDSAAAVYRRLGDGVPGHLSLSLGFLNVFNNRMDYPRSGQNGGRFLDPSFRADIAVSSELFLGDLDKAVAPLFERLAYGFDLRLQ